MRRQYFWVVPVLLLIAALATPAAVRAETEMLTDSWSNNDEDFADFTERLAAGNDVNLLTFPGAKIVEANGVESPERMHDGETGVRCHEGRIYISGNPSVVTYYLGKPRSISEIGVWTFNGDQRANQDFEVRVADNADKPGEKPNFPKAPTFTSGDKVLGANGGGFHTSFSSKDNAPLIDKKVDWVQFKIWRTYKVNAGTPAKQENKAESWTALIELQVLGDPSDPELFDSEEQRTAWIAERNRKKAERRLAEFGPGVMQALTNTNALRLAINDLADTYPDQYTKADDYLARLDAFEKEIADLVAPESLGKPETVDKLLDVAARYETLRREALLSNPLLDFEKLLVRKSSNPGLMSNWVTSCSRGKGNYGAEIMTLSPPRPDGELKTLVTPPGNSFVGDMCLHWDAKRMLVTALGTNNCWQIFEADVENGSLEQVTPGHQPDVDNAEACYIPDGAVVYSSTASMLGVPCVSGSQHVANLYRLEADGETIRQITFEQDQDWCPTVLDNGRVMYLRWEYTDNSHYFTRILMTMNPDGTNQMSYYGTNSFWPNSLFFAKPCPGHDTRFVGIVTGHHGTARAGELHLFDPNQGRKEADGVVQQIPGYGKKVEAKIVDRLVDPVWPKFLHPAPLSDKYLLVSCKMSESAPWGIYLVDVFDNMLPILVDKSTGYFEPTPVVEREAPPVIAPRVYPQLDEATVFLSDIYSGPGLEGVPRGKVKRLRVFSYAYGYRNIGGHDKFGMESGWDAKRLLGTVPVKEDGSAVFKIPANTPISLQPLDDEGRALQLMRSWLVAMPGEVLSCVGCHESAETAPGMRFATASMQRPDEIEPFYGPARPFSFDHEVQPVLDKYCVGCHDGKDASMPNFADKSTGPRGFSNAYHAMHGYVRRPGPESDVHVLRPLEYHTSTSELFQMLEKGHHNVELDRESWEKLHCWADLNVPYFGTWTDMTNVISGGNVFSGAKEPLGEISSRYLELRDLYATAAHDYEAEGSRPLPPPVQFVRPDRTKPTWPYVAAPEHWPMSSRRAKSLQASSGAEPLQTIELTDGPEITLARIPAGSFIMGDAKGELDENPRSVVTIDRPFYMMTTEVTNALFNRYFPEHDSRFIDQQWKDHTTPGYPANKPEQPVIRVTWAEAMTFCEKLSAETGLKCSLPTEAQWEWACRAGADAPFYFGDETADFTTYANLADEQLRKFVVRGVNPQPVNHDDFQAFIPRAQGFDDGRMIPDGVGQYEPNAWGLHDMHGNVAEWTLSDYKAYPYLVDDGRNAGDLSTKKAVRGGSWRDRPSRARAGARLGYEPWQRVFNVGFRVVCEMPEQDSVAMAKAE